MPVLLDGREVPSDCEAWRLECEARFALAQPRPADYLAEVAKRSAARAVTLRAAMVAQWRRADGKGRQ